MTKWNYRVIQNIHGELGIHEVYYNDDGIPVACSQNPSPIIVDAELGMPGLLFEIEKMHDACSKPVLLEQYFIELGTKQAQKEYAQQP